MYTSYFGRLREIRKAGLKPVAITRGVPKWYEGAVEQSLAPTWAMLRMSREDYDREFQKLLDRLNPRGVYESLGENAVLLCYEKPGEWCHRRLVAEWFEKELGIVVPEFGFTREATVPYELCGRERHQEQQKRRQPEQKELFRQLELI